jgi:threonine aldolase
MIDLRSDTLTKPTKAMHEAMFSAQVGDDVFGEDPTINALQEKAAAMFGMEAGLFCPSGTMTNQIAIRVHTQPQDEVICDKRSHIYLYEGGGMMSNSGVSVRLLEGNRGILNPEMIAENIHPDDIHFPVSRLVSLENTCNKGGGSYYTLPQIAAISDLCKSQHLRLHLDGARVCNALIATGENAQEYGKYFDTISLCLSKGLGAPVGSVLLGSKEMIRKALRVRKSMGGGMRQAGFLAAAGIYALDHHIERLKEDHQRAQIIGKALEANPKIVEVMPVDTNIIIFQPDKNWKSNTETLLYLAEKGIKAAPFGALHIRFVTHLDITDEMMEKVVAVIKEI